MYFLLLGKKIKIQRAEAEKALTYLMLFQQNNLKLKLEIQNQL